jgi:hypothetical protein
MSGMRDRLTRIERGLEDPRVDVLELVNWVYAEQQLAHLAQHRGSDYRWLVGAGISADGVVAVARIGILGVRVDVSAAMRALHPVAETVHYPVAQEITSMSSPAWLIPHFAAQKAIPPGFDLKISLGLQWKPTGRNTISFPMPRAKARRVQARERWARGLSALLSARVRSWA